MILIDTPKFYPSAGYYSHMVGSSIKELHEFAQAVGINKCWYSNKRGKQNPHYDVREYLYKTCLHLGAQAVDTRTIVEFLKKTYPKQKNALQPFRDGK